MQLKWFGGAMEVGRSCVYMKENNFKCLIDCGVKLSSEDMYPDLTNINFSDLDAVIVSHAHLDHCGYVPYLFAHGYTGPVFATHPTRRIAKVIQDDFAKIQKEENGWSPYWREDVRKTKKHTVALDYLEKAQLAKNVFLTFHDAGHILGSAQVLIETPQSSLLYSGDINTTKTQVMGAADTYTGANTLIVEGTYGKRDDIHTTLRKNEKRLIEIINSTIKRGGKVVIPVFAIGRAQNILVTLKKAMENGDINCPIYLDGMLQKINDIYDDFPEWMNKKMYEEFKKGSPLDSPYFTTVRNRKSVLELSKPAVIVTTAGMMSGGPVLSYFEKWAEGKLNTFALVGYQVEGTLGRMLVDGQKKFLLNNKKINVKTQIESLDFSAHADHKGLVNYVKNLKKKPTNIFLNHGDPDNLKEFAESLGEGVVVAQPLNVYTIKEERLEFKPIVPVFAKEPIELVTTTPRDEIMKNYMIQMIRSAKNSILVAGYVDTSLSNEFIEAMKRNVDVRMVFRHITRPSNRQAYELLKRYGVHIRENSELHARALIIDDRYALISTADITRDSFYDHYEAGFLVKDQNVVGRTRAFYEKIWQESSET
ncbi:MAG: MBL fold metallo-hydrolase RNA specificity domain-containing protein [Candidatus Methanofastidiosia archaeon]